MDISGQDRAAWEDPSIKMIGTLRDATHTIPDMISPICDYKDS